MELGYRQQEREWNATIATPLSARKPHSLGRQAEVDIVEHLSSNAWKQALVAARDAATRQTSKLSLQRLAAEPFKSNPIMREVIA